LEPKVGRRLALIVGNAAYQDPKLARLIYELMIDDFTRAYRGDRPPIDAVIDRLDYPGPVQLGLAALAVLIRRAHRFIL
jgi:hypothetical protein